MIRIDQLKLPVNFSDGDVKRQLSKLMGVSYNDICGYEFIKKSIDSRDKRQIKYVVSLAVKLVGEGKYCKEKGSDDLYATSKRNNRVVSKSVAVSAQASCDSRFGTGRTLCRTYACQGRI